MPNIHILVFHLHGKIIADYCQQEFLLPEQWMHRFDMCVKKTELLDCSPVPLEEQKTAKRDDALIAHFASNITNKAVSQNSLLISTSLGFLPKETYFKMHAFNSLVFSIFEMKRKTSCGRPFVGSLTPCCLQIKLKNTNGGSRIVLYLWHR